MGDITKNVMAMLIFALLLGAMGVTLFMIIKVQTTDDKILGDEYVIPVQATNAIISLVLSYIIMTDENLSATYRVFLTLLIIAAIASEIYFTGYEDRKFESGLTYGVIMLGFLLRSFLLLGYVRGAFPEGIETNVIAPVEKAVNRATRPLTTMIPDMKKSEPVQSNLILRWTKLKTALKERPEGVSNLSEAWEKVVNPANKAGRTDVQAVLKEAVALLKDKEGNPVPANIVGGARK